jgi:hypothetical protein
MISVVDYNIADFQIDCDAFNSIAGKDEKTTHKDLCRQYYLIEEELRETRTGLAKNDLEEVLDGTIDVLVTTLGMLQKLKNLGFDVSKAMLTTAENNHSKYPITEALAIETAEMYDKQDIDVKVSYNSQYDVFVIKDSNDKIRKPSNFVSNDLKDCLPNIEGFKDFDISNLSSENWS